MSSPLFEQQRIFYALWPAWSLSLEVTFHPVLVALGPVAIRACRPMRSRRTRVAVCAAGCLARFAAPCAWIAVAQGVFTAAHGGGISYSLFIWHEPVMPQLLRTGLLPTGQAGFPLAVAIVLLVAVPTAVARYWLVEYPASLLGRLKDAAGRPREFYPEPVRRTAAVTAPARPTGRGCPRRARGRAPDVRRRDSARSR